jgi:hypothetical protein
MRKYEVVDSFTVTMVKTGRPASYRKGAVMTFLRAEDGRCYFTDPYGEECYTEKRLLWLEGQGAIKRLGNYVRSDRKFGVGQGQKPFMGRR